MLVIKQEVKTVTIEIQIPTIVLDNLRYMENEKKAEEIVEEIYRNSYPKGDTEAPDACNSCCEQESGKYDVENIFTYHSPQPGQPERYTVLRAGAKELAKMILEACPDSREREQALTKLEEAVFWANASVARNHNEDG